MKRWGWIGSIVVLIAVVTGGFFFARRAEAEPGIPTSEAKLGEFVDSLQLRCEVKATKTLVLTAPSGAGDLQILELARNGQQLKAGEVAVQFDVTSLQRTLQTRKSELKEAQAEIDRMRAQARLTREQTLTDLQKAQYDVERARLNVGRQEILSAIDGDKAKLELADAEQKLKEIQQKLESDKKKEAADVAIRELKKRKAQFEVDKTERDIASMTLKAPIDGMVTILPNFRAGRPGPQAPPEFRQGDRAWSGAGVVELPDLSTIRVTSRVDELDRGRLQVGQRALVRVDAIPDKELSGKVVEIGAIAKVDMSSWPPVKNFDVVVQLEQTDPRLRPGMSATARVEVLKVPNTVLVPTQAVFERNGRTVLYVRNGRRFEEKQIVISHRGKETIAVKDGVKAGDKIAMQDPMVVEQATK